LSEFYKIPESIECNAANVVARKIVKTALIEEEKIGICQKYKCSRNSSATVKKELNPLEFLKCNTSKLKLDDCLVAEDLFFFTKGYKKLRISLINESGRHKAQTTDTSSYTYAEITKPFEHIMKALHQRELLALNQKNNMISKMYK